MIIFCDGASNPHTKRSGIGAVWFDTKPYIKPIHTISKEIFKNKGHPTCNEAEYQSLIHALKYQTLNPSSDQIIIYMDSKLVVNQVNNKWKINYPHLQKLKNQVDELRKQTPFTLIHIRRHLNQYADKASKDCLVTNYFKDWISS